jgi:hypothetical protein
VTVALVIQHATRMRNTVIIDLSGCTIFLHLISQTARFFLIKFIEHKTRAFIFYTTLFETFLILRRTERDMIKNVNNTSRKVLVILVRF